MLTADQLTEAAKRAAIEVAFNDRVSLLFKNRCDAHDDPQAEARFDHGLEIALNVRKQALEKL